METEESVKLGKEELILSGGRLVWSYRVVMYEKEPLLGTTSNVTLSAALDIKF